MQWQHASAKSYYEKLKKEIGEPSILSLRKGGLALWLKSDLENVKFYGIPNCFEEIMIRDEGIRHRCPANHTDFLYSYVYVDIGPDILPIIISISGSISYDPLKKLLSARCGSIEANVATLRLCTDILTDKLDTKEYFNLAPLYGSMIKSTKDENVARQLYQGLCNNLQELGRPSMSDYWIGAFDADCNEPLPQFQWNSVCDKADKLKKPKTQSGGRKDKPQRGSGKKDKADKPQRGSGRKDKADKPQRGSGKKDKADKPQWGARHNDKADKPQRGSGRKDKAGRGSGKKDKVDKPFWKFW